jgi:glycosyltransferase involved in cell wall biosynthesis
MITKNEAENIERCLNSVNGLVDQVIVVDTGSTDGTYETAMHCGAEVYHSEWEDDFSKARNASLRQAKADWVLILDADEEIAQKDKEKIRAHLRRKKVSGYLVMTCNYSNEPGGLNWVPLSPDEQGTWRGARGWYPSWKVRLLRNRRNYLFEGRVHEIIDDSIRCRGGVIKNARFCVRHYGWLDHGKKLHKQKHYLEIAEKVFRQDAEDPKALYMLGLHYCRDKKMYHQGMWCLERSAAIRPKVETFLALVDFHKELGDINAAISYGLKAVSLVPDYAVSYTNLGDLYLRIERFQSARDCFRNAIKNGLRLPNAHCGLGAALAAMNETEAAENEFKLALSMSFDYLPALQGLSSLYARSGRRHEAIAVYKKISEMMPKAIDPHIVLATLYHLTGQHEKAKEAARTVLDLAPDHPVALDVLDKTPQAVRS